MISVLMTILGLGYLLGSFPSGYFAGRLAHVDVRAVGSGNIGATNVLRVLGKPWGYTVFCADVLKGFATVRLAFLIIRHFELPSGQAHYLAILAAVMCVIGHTFPVWLRFRGGKGVATSAGAIFGLMPWAALIVFLIWLIVFQITRYVSVASITAAISLPIAVGALLHFKVIDAIALLYFSIAMSLLVIWSHRSNLSRLVRGTEQRFTRK